MDVAEESNWNLYEYMANRIGIPDKIYYYFVDLIPPLREHRIILENLYVSHAGMIMQP